MVYVGFWSMDRSQGSCVTKGNAPYRSEPQPAHLSPALLPPRAIVRIRGATASEVQGSVLHPRVFPPWRCFPRPRLALPRLRFRLLSTRDSVFVFVFLSFFVFCFLQTKELKSIDYVLGEGKLYSLYFWVCSPFPPFQTSYSHSLDLTSSLPLPWSSGVPLSTTPEG